MKRTLIFLLLPAIAFSSSYEKLPVWTHTLLSTLDLTKLNSESGLVNLSDTTTFESVGNKLKITRRLLRYVTRERGVDDASLYLMNGDEQSGKLLNLKGWNLLPSGKMVKLDKDNVVTVGTSSVDEITRDTLTGAYLDDVVKGSIVVFESQSEETTYFGTTHLSLFSEHPTQTMSIYTSGPNFTGIELLNGEDWGFEVEAQPGSLRITNIPGFEREPYSPSFYDAIPMVKIHHNSGLQKGQWESWDSLAKWYVGLFSGKSGAKGTEKAADTKEGLEQIHRWVDEKLSYRQVYLTLSRGWEPLKAAEVARLAYGDCKDMACAMSGQASAAGLQALPALVSVSNQRLRLDEHSKPTPSFNHLIAAFPLAKSLGLPAEVERNGKRFLLIDGTAKGMPFGYLPGHYRGLSLMICSPEGALWVKVPDQALEKQELHATIKGRLDQNGDLKGRLELRELGNAIWMRHTLRMTSAGQLEPLIREHFEIPGVVDLKLVESGIEGNAQAKVAYEITWPSFLRHDEDGLTLPTGLLTYALSTLERGGLARQLPIQMNGSAPTHWTIELETENGLRSGGQDGSVDSPFYHCKWKTTAGKTFKLEVSQEFLPCFYSRKERKEGVSAWKNARNDFNSRFSSVLILYPL